ncbi:MAG: hypothetical protein BHV98_08175 [Clostridium sp. CAG:217_53_7]|nr:MAG: hypothetical protein BHV98_08175 [Clostridium sp. CAG:217_53_7]
MDSWIAEAVGTMHINKITQKAVASKMGCTTDYISMILTGKRKPPQAKERILGAINTHRYSEVSHMKCFWIIIWAVCTLMITAHALLERWKLKAILYYLAKENISFSETDMEACLQQVLEHKFKQ